MRHFLLAFLALIVGFTSGCVSYSNTSEEIEKRTSLIKVGVTTKSQIHSIFGIPTGTSMTTINAQPTEVWNYHLVTATTNPFLSVPVVGPLIIPSENAVVSENRTFTFYFSERGILRGVTREIEHNNMEAEMQAGLNTEMKRHTFSFAAPDKGRQNLSQESLEKIEMYQSTKDEVQKILGKPTTISSIKTADGLQNLWTYFYTNTNPLEGENEGSSHRFLFNNQDVVIGLTTTDHSWIMAPLD